MKFCRTDAQSIHSQIKRQEKQIKLKRRWLLGIKASKSERKKLNKSKFFQKQFLCESLLREDDIFYETVRTHVQGDFGAPCIETTNHLPQDDMHLINVPYSKLKRLILACLDNLTTKGLYLLARIVIDDSIKSEIISRCNLKKIVKDSLSSVLGKRSQNNRHLEIRKQIFELLSNSQNFRVRCEPLSSLGSQSYHAAVAKVLGGLQNLSSQTLIAMRRKLKGVKASLPQLQPRKHGWGRDHLIKLVEKISGEMLLQLDGGNELPEPLAKAMAVADISLRLTTGCNNIFSKEFYQFSPEVQSLQSDIMNAIWSVKEVVTVAMLRNLQLLVEPKATISNRCLRTAFVNYLTEFLFECSDMDNVPKYLSQILDLINKSSNSMDGVLSQKYIDEEVDCILNVSAQTKQILLDLLPDNGFDQDFTDAYMEELEESDDSDSEEDDDDDDDGQLKEDRKLIDGTVNSMDSNYVAESIGDFAPSEYHPYTSMTEENGSFCSLTTGGRLNSASGKHQPKNFDDVNLDSEVYNTPHNMIINQFQGESTEDISTCMASRNFTSSVVSPYKGSEGNDSQRHSLNESDTEIDPRDAVNLFCKETKFIPTKNSIRKNQYLSIQDACDKTSMLAHNLIGHLLEEFAGNEGLDLNLRKKSYLQSDNRIEDVEETKKYSSSGNSRCSSIVKVVKELIPSFPDSGMDRLKMLMDL